MADQVGGAQSAMLSKLLESGKAVMLGEWRGCKPEVINYTNTKGAKASFGRLSHTIEVGSGDKIESVKVGQTVPDGVAPDSVVCPFKRGQRVVIEVDSMTVDKGTRNVRAAGIHAG